MPLDLLSPITDQQSFETRSIHGGVQPDPTTGAILTPIYQCSTFVQEAVGRDKGYTYSRTANPTVSALERQLGAIEGCLPAACFATGMAAISSLFFALLQAGDHVVVSDVVYGGTVRLLRQILSRFGVSASFVDPSQPGALETALQRPTRLVLIETPGNPTLKLVDIASVCETAHAHGVPVAVDNTFLTAALQDCFALGADLVVYSTTKFIEGHNSTVGGAVLTRDPALLEKIRFVQNSLGCGQSPFQAWLTLRGLKTLRLRLQQHSANALQVARWLEAHPQVAHVAHPFLESFPQYALAKRQQKDGGGLLAFELHGGGHAGIALMNRVQLCSLAENLGAVETLITHPASMTHAAVPEEDRAAAGISDGLVRLSVGLESPQDIIDDLAQALAG